ncbi:MAG: LytTR family DNA-binding domain-containing protein [Parvularculaceae bacterium]
MIVDDEPLAARRLEILVSKIANVQLSGVAHSCQEAADKFSQQQADIILLDICMRDGDGFDFLAKLPATSAPAVIFVTAFDRFAVRAFETAAVDYLLKPVESWRLEAAIDRAHRFLQINEVEFRFDALRATIEQLRDELRTKTGPANDDIWVNGPNGEHKRISVEEIEFATSEGEYVQIHTVAGKYLVRTSLRKLLANLDEDVFIRTHRAAMVRISAIDALKNKGLASAEVTLKSGAHVPLGRVHAKNVRNVLFHYKK